MQVEGFVVGRAHRATNGHDTPYILGMPSTNPGVSEVRSCSSSRKFRKRFAAEQATRQEHLEKLVLMPLLCNSKILRGRLCVYAIGGLIIGWTRYLVGNVISLYPNSNACFHGLLEMRRKRGLLT